ncbi:MAG: hypothetical protein H0T76_19965 [Nannocystis sp.]|nr:BRCT domain-containing protein [Nannocystis sp.]MBA3548764.1 hypothetical protein [Nannocystis sp.]
MSLDVRGKTVVLTGTFSRLKRAEAESRLAELGAKIGGSVGKTTHILFAGEKAGSKINAATRLGVTVLGEDELMAVLAGEAQATPEATDTAPVFASLDPSQAGPALAAAIEALPWDSFEVDRDLPGLREALYAHEAAHGITAAHRAATARLRPRALLTHAHGHDVEVEWSDLSPDGRLLATGSWVGDDYERGGVLQIWDVRAGRCVNMLRIRGGVGWPDYAGCIQWRPDSRRVGLAFDTNGVGSFDPFARSGEPDSCAYVTDGWSRPPSWVWSPNSRDVYIACWGPGLALGAIVALVGRRPEPRWCEQVGRVDPKDPDSEPRLQPPRNIDWAHPERIVGDCGSQMFALDATTGKIVWEGMAHPPVSFSPDGTEFAMHPAGLVYYDTRTGLPNGKLPMHLGAESFVYSRDGSRLAALVQPGNRWGAEPGIFIYDRGDYRYSPDVPPLTAGDYHCSWHPDGGKIAVTAAGRLQIWALHESPAQVLDIAAPDGGHVMYGDGVLITHASFGLVFRQERDGAVIGGFQPAIEASGESPLAGDGDDLGAAWAWNPAFPLDRERVAAALPEGVVIGPPAATASVEEVDSKIAWVVDRKWAWPWRWGEAKVWPDAAAACADQAAPTALKKRFAQKQAKAGKSKATAKETTPARPKKVSWPPPGGTLDDIAGLLEQGIKQIPDGYHGGDYRRKYAVRTMAHGLFDRAAAAIDGGPGWTEWAEPWFAALARGETVMTALALRVADAPALTPGQTETLRRWLDEAEALLKKKATQNRPLCQPRAVIGASWILLGEAEDGEALLMAAIRGIDPEGNTTEHRRTVAEALAVLGRVREAAKHLTSSKDKPSWTQTPPAIAAICARGSVEDLQYLLQRMKEHGAHNEFVLLDRGLARLIALRAWDAAVGWTLEFDGLSTRLAQIRVATAMVAAGEAKRAEAALAAGLAPAHATCAELLLALAHILPERARVYLEPIVEAAPRLLAGAYSPVEFLHQLTGAAALLGRLDVAAKLEGIARGPGEAQEARLGVLAALDPTHPEWGAWFARARTGLSGSRSDAMRLAAMASRGGQAEASAELLNAAIEAARGESFVDIQLMEVSAAMTAVGDLAGAHRAWMAIAKGRRSHRNDPLLAACEQRGLWAAALEILRQMPQDLNGSPQRASKMLLTAAGGEGY